MDVWHHAWVTLIVTAILYPFFGALAFFAILGGVLIDFDHYLWCIYDRKDLSIHRAYHHCKYGNALNQLHIFHTVECWIVIIVLSFFYVPVMIAGLGMVPHLLMDTYDMSVRNRHDGRTISIITWLLRKRKKS